MLVTLSSQWFCLGVQVALIGSNLSDDPDKYCRSGELATYTHAIFTV